MFHRSKRGFTLIELLIVVAIIGILAAIAVPNFLEAQVRAKVAKAVSEMRTVMVAAELYYVDEGNYPACHEWGTSNYIQPPMFRCKVLSTPVEYLSSIPFLDPFGLYKIIFDPVYGRGWDWSSHYEWRHYDQLAIADQDGDFNVAVANIHGHPGCWMESRGPDMEFFFFGYWRGMTFPDCQVNYDATNGTISWGDVRRFSSGQGKYEAVTVDGVTY